MTSVTENKERMVNEHCIGICIPNGTDQDGVSLLKAALLATVEEQLVTAMPHLNPKILPDDSEFEVCMPPSEQYRKPELIYPLYSCIKGTVRYVVDKADERTGSAE